MTDAPVRVAFPEDVPWVKRQADRHRAEVGFVRLPALVGAAAEGELLVGLGGAGFCRWHRRRDGWSVVYELVSESPGTGRALLEAVPLPRRLRCPADLPANGFYAHLGGVLVRQEPGKRRPLNVWEWST